MENEQIWLIIGFIGQTIFASRFLIQWVVSERASKSIIPNIFWWISLAGSMILRCVPDEVRYDYMNALFKLQSSWVNKENARTTKELFKIMQSVHFSKVQNYARIKMMLSSNWQQSIQEMVKK